MLDNDEIEKKLKDHDQKFKDLYTTTDDLVKRIRKLEEELAELGAKASSSRR